MTWLEPWKCFPRTSLFWTLLSVIILGLNINSRVNANGSTFHFLWQLLGLLKQCSISKTCVRQPSRLGWLISKNRVTQLEVTSLRKQTSCRGRWSFSQESQPHPIPGKGRLGSLWMSNPIVRLLDVCPSGTVTGLQIYNGVSLRLRHHSMGSSGYLLFFWGTWGFLRDFV